MTPDVDILIVGSGPAGATYARTLTDELPGVRVLMVEAGPRLTPRAGVNVATLTDPEQRARAQRLAQGPAQDEAESVWPGTHVVGAGAEMPAASISTGVGGMGAHWNCVTPRPWGPERIGLWPDDEWDGAVAAAERLLGTTTTGAMPGSPWGARSRDRLGRLYHTLPPGRTVGELPVALARTEDGRLGCTGVDTILGRLAGPAPDGFELRPETLCCRVLVEGGTAVGAVLVDRRTGAQSTISAAVVVVAADALRTPQLLWASAIRPAALGCFLNDQPQVVSSVLPAADLADPADPADPTVTAGVGTSPLYPMVDSASGAVCGAAASLPRPGDAVRRRADRAELVLPQGDPRAGPAGLHLRRVRRVWPAADPHPVRADHARPGQRGRRDTGAGARGRGPGYLRAGRRAGAAAGRELTALPGHGTDGPGRRRPFGVRPVLEGVGLPEPVRGR